GVEAAACGLGLARCGFRHHPDEEREHRDPEQRDQPARDDHARIDDDSAHPRAAWLLRRFGHHGQCTGKSAMLKGMSLRGSLGTMSAEDVLDWVNRRKLSAAVTFARRDLERGLVIEEGQIVWASSNSRDEQLGVILVRSSLVQERALADALEARA